jgi:ankyrin repeat protein
MGTNLHKILEDAIAELSKPDLRESTLTFLQRNGMPEPYRNDIADEQEHQLGQLRNLLEKAPPADKKGKSPISEALESKIRNFLAERWQIIQKTTAAYTDYPESTINQVCEQLAFAVARPDEAIAKILMPTIEVEHYGIDDTLIELTEDENRKVLWHKFILSADQKAIIHLEDWFVNSQDIRHKALHLDHLYRFYPGESTSRPTGENSAADLANSREVKLNEADLALLSHSVLPGSADFIEIVSYRLKHVLSNNDYEENMAVALIKLIDGLRAAEAYQGKGTPAQAHKSAFPVIESFFKILNAQGNSNISKLTKLKAQNYKQLNSYLIVLKHGAGMQLSAAEKTQHKRDNLTTCIAHHGNAIQAILNENYETFSGNSQQVSLQEAHKTTQKILGNRTTAELNTQRYADGAERLNIALLQNTDPDTALTKAVTSSKLEFVDGLLDKNAKFFNPEKYTDDALGHAVTNNHIEVANKFLSKMSKDDIKTALHKMYFVGGNLWALRLAEIAAKNNATNMLATLVGHGAPHSGAFIANNVVRNNLLDWAYNQYQDIDTQALLTALIESNCSLHETHQYGKESIELPVFLVYKNYTSAFDACIARQDFQIHEQDPDANENLLAISAAFLHTDITKKLLNAGASIMEENRFGEDALYHVVATGKNDIFRLFLQSTQDLSLDKKYRNKQGVYSTITQIAYKKSNFEALSMLVEKNALLPQDFADGKTLMELLFGRCEEESALQNNEHVQSIIQSIARTEADFTVKMPDGSEQNLFYTACYSGNLPFVNSYISNGLPLNKRYGNGNTATHAAVANSQIDVLDMLIKNDADINLANNEGEKPLHVALTRRKMEMAPKILEVSIGKAAKAQNRSELNQLGSAAAYYNLTAAYEKAVANGATVNHDNFYALRCAVCDKNHALTTFISTHNDFNRSEFKTYLDKNQDFAKAYNDQLLLAYSNGLGQLKKLMQEKVAADQITALVHYWELSATPDLDKLYQYYGFEKLCKFANIKPSSDNAVKLFVRAYICHLNSCEDKSKAAELQAAIFGEGLDVKILGKNLPSSTANGWTPTRNGQSGPSQSLHTVTQLPEQLTGRFPKLGRSQNDEITF